MFEGSLVLGCWSLVLGAFCDSPRANHKIYLPLRLFAAYLAG